MVFQTNFILNHFILIPNIYSVMKSRKSILVLLSAGAVLGACQKKEENQGAPTIQAIKVSVQEMTETARKQSLQFSGSIEADHITTMGFSIPGTIEAVYIQEGQMVKKGQLLARIQADDFVNNLSIAEAGLMQVEDLHKRMTIMYEAGSLAEKDYVDIQSKRKQALAGRNIAAKKVKDTYLYAPTEGIIAMKNIEPGMTVAPDAPPLLTIVKTNPVFAKVSVPEPQIGKIFVGQMAKVRIPSLDKDLTGKVLIINPMADPVSKSYSVKIQLSNGDLKLLPGMIAEAEINLDKETMVLSLPPQAVVVDPNGVQYVFVADDTRKQAQRRRVKVGPFTGKDITILDGINTGEKVVIAGQQKLHDGEAIQF
jgi:membrane fusion protein, multidrug efflux system